MKKLLSFLIILNGLFLPAAYSQFHHFNPHLSRSGKGLVNTKADNIGYWVKMARKGYVLPDSIPPVPKAVFSTSRISGFGVRTQDSPDVPLSEDEAVTLSENSVFVNPEDEDFVLSSDNSTDWAGSTVHVLNGANALFSDNTGLTWSGDVDYAGIANMGDPATAIGLNGWLYVGKINGGMGQSIAYSTDNGLSWHDIEILTPTGSMDLLDKNHLWIDNSIFSPYSGYLYSAWTNMVNGSLNENQIELVRSVNHGLSWSDPVVISAAVSAGSHNQGVNLQTGPNGEVYVAWAVYDSWPSDEVAYGFSKSLDGGAIFTPGMRMINNTRGIRSTGTSKNMRVNSFPVMAVDNSSGPYRGTIYVVFSNIGYPGTNTGTDIDVYLIKSEDNGNTWSSPIRINQDPAGIGKQHFFPWITCDAMNGNLCVIYYDDRNTGSTSCETWISYSYDGGETWSDMKVSDVSFTPSPVQGLAIGYFGDYLGITSRNRNVYPVWTDNRSGRAMSYVSPVSLGPAPGQPFVVVNSYDLSTIPKQASQQMNYGDSLYMDLTLQNIGDQPVSLVSAYLSTPSPYIRVTDSTGYYGFFTPGETKDLPMGYSFKVSDTIPSGYKARFNVRIESVDTTWMSHFTIQAHAPGLKINGMAIIDTLSGNGNSRLDPGETAVVSVSLSNTGDFPCPNPLVTLSSGSDFLTLLSDSVPLDTIHPGENKVADFVVRVDDNACLGSVVDLAIRACSGKYIVRRTFTEIVSGITEDWESHAFTKFPWTFSGDKQWTIDTVHYAGQYSAKSGWIYDYQSTGLVVNYTSGSDDSISFFRKVSSEANYDFLSFFIDEIKQDQWSGEQDWQQVSFAVPAGTHSFKWIYETDIYQLSGENAAWVDDIMFPPPPLPQVFAGPSDTLCGEGAYPLHGTASAADSVLWSTHGDGVFSNDTILDPLYYPGPGDISSGNVRLRLKGIGANGCYSSGMNLSIKDLPSAHIQAEPVDTLCAGQTFQLSAESVEGAGYLWQPGNLTSREISVDTTTTGGTGTYWITLRVTNSDGCSSSDSVRLTFRDCTVMNEKNNGFSASVYPNPGRGEFILDILSQGHEKIRITLLNSLDKPVAGGIDFPVSGSCRKHYDFRNLPEGVYFLVIEHDTGSVCLKVVIVR